MVDNHEVISKSLRRHTLKHSLDSLFGVLDICWPYPKAHNARVLKRGCHSTVGKIFVKRDHDHLMFAGVRKDGLIRATFEASENDMLDGPLRSHRLQPLQKLNGDILVQQNADFSLRGG